MDLTLQPPRRPSNISMGGIVGLARMTDKARGHNAELIGEYKFGRDSGLDVDVLGFIGMSGEEFADLVEEMRDDELAALVREKAGHGEAEIEQFNRSWLEREPKDDLHRQLLVERVAKYAPGSTDITTVLRSMELDDWGMFRHRDLTQGPPRTPYLRSVAGVAAVARMSDKARAKKADKLGEYMYGTDSRLDLWLLEFLKISDEEFLELAYRNPNDKELSAEIAARRSFSTGEIAAFNARIATCGLNTPDLNERFRSRREEICPERVDIENFCDLIDYDDEHSFSLVDLNRRAPRSPYDRHIGGVTGLARMIDKGRAHNSGTLGAYWYGEDSGFDRRILEFLGLTQEEFAGALEKCSGDAKIVSWMGERLTSKTAEEISSFCDALCSLAPTNDKQRQFLDGILLRLDSQRGDIDTFMALTALDDKVTFARLHALY